MSKLKIEKTENGIIFKAKIIPSASRTIVSGLLDGMLKIKVSAPPEKGKANRFLIGFLAEQLDVSKKTVGIISGKTSPVKQILVSGISAESFIKKLNLK